MSTAENEPSSSKTSLYECLLPSVRPRLEKDGRLSVWRLPSDISQSRLGGRTSPSNACTLIALQLIEYFERRDLHFVSPTSLRLPLTPLRPPQRAPAGGETRSVMMTVCPTYLLGTFAEAMVEGNEIHGRATKSRKADEQNFTIPDAINAFQKDFTELDFCSVTGSFSVQLPKFIRIAMRSPSLCSLPRLHFIIIAFERTVLLVADRRTDTLILLDSHLHGSLCGQTTGAILASSHLSDLSTLVQWMSENIFPETHSATCVQEFEISTVVYTGSEEDCGLRLRSSSRLAARALKPMQLFSLPSPPKENRPPTSSLPKVKSPAISQPKLLCKRTIDSSEHQPPGSSDLKRARIIEPQIDIHEIVID